MVLSPRQERAIAARDAMETGGRAAPLVPRTFIEAQAFCGALAQSDLIPQKLKDRAADVLVLVLAGMEIGLTPMASIRLHHVIEGIPRLSSDGLASIIMTSPECEYLDCSQSSDTSCTWITKRRGRPERSCTWTIDRAKRAGLTDKRNRDGSPGMWAKYPENMLSARAKAELCRLVYPDIAAGLRTIEEAVDRDFIDVEYTEQIAKPTFVAPPSPPPGVPIAPPAAVTFTPNKPDGTVTVIGVEPPKRGPGRPPKDKPADPTPAGASRTSPEPSASTSRAATGSNSEAAPVASSPTQVPAEKPAAPIEGDVILDKWGQPVGHRDPSSLASTPSAESALISNSATLSGAQVAPAADDGFGDDPPDAGPEMSVPRFLVWVAGCKSQGELQAGLLRWRAWSQDQARAGDASFEKKGANTQIMQDAYSKRKGEVPA